MDIDTPRGQKSLEYERECIQLFCDLYPQYRYLETDKRLPASIDGVMYLHSQNFMAAAVEVKCRNMTKSELFGKYNGEWLLTYGKLKRGKKLSEFLCLPFIGMVYLIPEKTILTIKLTDNRGNYIVDFNVRESATTKSINDHDMELGENAFIPMKGAKEHKCSMK